MAVMRYDDLCRVKRLMQMMNSKIVPLKMVLAVLSGLLIFLSFPKYGSGIVAWAALIRHGEYVPLRSLFPFINKLVAGVGDFKPGKGYYPLNTGRSSFGSSDLL